MSTPASPRLDPVRRTSSCSFLRSDPKPLGERRQVAAAFFGYDYQVFDADAAHVRVVDARLHRDDVAGNELLVGQRDAGGLVDLQPNPMPCAVEEAHSERFTFLLVVDVRLVASL